MIKSLSYRSLEHGPAKAHPIDQALRQVRDEGFDGIEPCIAPKGKPTTEMTEERCKSICDTIDVSGLTVQTR